MKKKEPEIMRVLVISTTHVTLEDSTVMTREFPSDEYGFWVPTSLRREGGINFSDDFWAALEMGVKNECNYVNFDRDGSVRDELNTHDW